MMQKISGAIKKFILGKQNSLFENICLCVAVTLASAFIWFDNFYFYTDFLSAVTSVLMMLMWLWCGFISGKNKQWGFLVFAGAYWLLPYLYMLVYMAYDSGDTYGSFSTLVYKFSRMIYEYPMSTIADFTKCDVNIWVLSLAIIIGTAYFIGINVADIYRGKEKPGYAEDTDDDET